jgi:CxxC motif-containing protein
MTSRHEYTCVNCPMSCSLELTEENGAIAEVTGQQCKVGRRYAEEEFTDPRRVLTTTVPVTNGALRLLPVRSAEAIPKRLLLQAARVLSGVVVDAPVTGGQVILGDVLGTGVDVISSRELGRAEGRPPGAVADGGRTGAS